MMSRSWTRSQQRHYKEERQLQALRVADRLMGKRKKVDPDPDDFFGGTQMYSPIQYRGISSGVYVASPRTSFILSGFNGV